MRIYLTLGHPDRDTFNGAVADRYEAAARAAGHEVRRQDLGTMRFDPILWHGYKHVQTLEPDLVSAQENILWCDHWVIIYPIWWGNLPALLKGYLDRVLYSGFAYKYHTKGPLWDKLLSGRSGRLITTCDAPWWWIWWQYGNADIHALRSATLEFCGVSPVNVTRIDRVRFLDDKARVRWLDRVEQLVPAPRA